MDWSVSSETIETLEYREHASDSEVSAETAADEPSAVNFLEEIAVAFKQCCEAGEKFYISVVSWATPKPDGQRSGSPGIDFRCVKGKREIQLTSAAETEFGVSNAVETDL